MKVNASPPIRGSALKNASGSPRFVVEMLNIRKSFSGVPALRGCNLQVLGGEIHALLGQNGAGKSTLVKILNGVLPRDSFEGDVRIEGCEASFRSPAQARRSGVGYVPQEIELIEHLSVTENILCGQMHASGNGLVRWTQLESQASVLLRELGLSLNVSEPVEWLSPAQRHLVMIARALAARPAVLILDEPTASLSEPEIARLFAVLRTLKARGATTIYITHRLPEVIALCDRASVLRDGVIAAEFDRTTFSVEALVTAMSSRRVESQYPHHRKTVESETLLKIENLTVKQHGRDRVRDVSFELRRGEILGIAGPLGAGRTELLGAIYGHLRNRASFWFENKSVSIKSTRDARLIGIALLTEDRKRDGLLFNLPLRGNVTVGSLGLFSRSGVVNAGRERETVRRQIADLKVKASSTEETVSHLSGGNQQKLLFARVLLRAPKVLLLDEPTKGVDVATRQDIYRLIVTLADRGMGIIVVSSELEEVLGLSDRCLVMAEGRFIDEFLRGEGSEQRVLHAVAAAQLSAMTRNVSGSDLPS